MTRSFTGRWGHCVRTPGVTSFVLKFVFLISSTVIFVETPTFSLIPFFGLSRAENRRAKVLTTVPSP